LGRWALSKAEVARESDRLRSLLLDSVSHEFRTPLTAIKASAETLLSEVELDQPQLKELATVINEESDRLNHLVGGGSRGGATGCARGRTACTSSRKPSGKRALEHYRIELSIADNLPPLKMDSGRITEVLMQLLENGGAGR